MRLFVDDERDMSDSHLRIVEVCLLAMVALKAGKYC